MKKFFLLCVFILTTLLSFDSHAQGGAYNEGDKIFMAGVGLGSYYHGGIPLSASLEYGFHHRVSGGAFFGFTGYEFGSTFTVGGKATWHFLPVLNRELELNADDDRLDIYISGYLGLRQTTYRADRFLPGIPGSRGNITRPLLTASLGAKYFFTPNLAGFLELGGAIGWANLGVSLTF